MSSATHGDRERQAVAAKLATAAPSRTTPKPTTHPCSDAIVRSQEPPCDSDG